VYENCLAIELRTVGLVVKQQHSINVFYGSNLVGEFTADLLVEDCVLLELKAVKELNDIHQAQAINYLKASGLRLCLLINFGKRRIDIKRLAL
jgi:GxxExxY protein